MSLSTDARRTEVLRAIVTDYIASQEPVGSQTLVKRYKLGVSSATIRNDMAVLESEGYITQPHASSGRVPTEKAYRVFVDSIHDVKPLSLPERRAIVRFLEDGVDLEDVLHRSVQLLSQLTHQVAVVQMPRLTVSRVKHCEVVMLTPGLLLLVLITDTGRVEQRNVELDEAVEPHQVAVLRDVLNRVLAERTLADASAALVELNYNAPADIRVPLVRCSTVLIDTLVDAPSDRLILAGASNLTRTPSAFPNGLAAVLEALEEQVVVLKLLSNAHDLGLIRVSIGAEHEDNELKNTAMVATGYGTEERLGGMGVVGPTHMDYSSTMSKVQAVAAYVSQILHVR